MFVLKYLNTFSDRFCFNVQTISCLHSAWAFFWTLFFPFELAELASEASLYEVLVIKAVGYFLIYIPHFPFHKIKWMDQSRVTSLKGYSAMKFQCKMVFLTLPLHIEKKNTNLVSNTQSIKTLLGITYLNLDILKYVNNWQ